MFAQLRPQSPKRFYGLADPSYILYEMYEYVHIESTYMVNSHIYLRV